MSEDRPCPFCGSNNKHPAGGERGTICKRCGSESFYNWDSRPMEDAMRIRIEELENKLKELGIIDN